MRPASQATLAIPYITFCPLPRFPRASDARDRTPQHLLLAVGIEPPSQSAEAYIQDRSSSFRPLINEILRAPRERDLKELASAAGGVPEELPGLTPAELTAAIGELVPELTANAVGPFALIAGVATALVEAGGSPMPMRKALPERAFLSIYPAVTFPGLWKNASGGRPLPAPGD